MNSKHSVVMLISCYKNDTIDNLRTMFQSLVTQTFQDFDIFVQQDGPLSDDVENYLDTLLHSGKIMYVGKRSRNMGLAFSLNELVNQAMKSGYKYLVRMDADDICLPQRLKLQFEFMESHKNIDVVGSWMLEFHEDAGVEQIVRYPEQHEEIFSFMKKRCPMAHMTVFFRRTFFEKAGLYPTDTILNEDSALWFNGFKSGCIFHNLEMPLVKVRVNSNFYQRRSGLKKAIYDFKLKAKISKEFSFGLKGYFYALAYSILLLLPPRYKKMCYTHLRE